MPLRRMLGLTVGCGMDGETTGGDTWWIHHDLVYEQWWFFTMKTGADFGAKKHLWMVKNMVVSVSKFGKNGDLSMMDEVSNMMKDGGLSVKNREYWGCYP